MEGERKGGTEGGGRERNRDREKERERRKRENLLRLRRTGFIFLLVPSQMCWQE